MDFLRSAYRTKMRFFANDPREVYVRWYRADPAAPVVERHAFFSRNWDREKGLVDLPLGEVLGAPRPWDRGNTPLGATGAHQCGTAAEFVDGLSYPPVALTSYDVEGLPLCCQAGNPPDVEDDVRDINFWRQVQGAGLDVYYTGGSVTGQDVQPRQAEPDIIHALPLFAARGGGVDKLALFLDTVGSLGAQVRLAIYEAASETDLRPATLVSQTGDLAADVNPGKWLFQNIGVALDRLKLYWLCVNARNVSTMPIVGALSSVFVYNVLGFDQHSFSPYFGFKVPFAYGPYPLAFPATDQTTLANGIFAAAAVSYIF